MASGNNAFIISFFFFFFPDIIAWTGSNCAFVVETFFFFFKPGESVIATHRTLCSFYVKKKINNAYEGSHQNPQSTPETLWVMETLQIIYKCMANRGHHLDDVNFKTK